MDKFKKYFLVVMTVILLGELYFYPFSGSFRFSAGVLAFSLVILLIDDLKEIHLSFYIAFSILLLRVSMDIFITSNNLTYIFTNNLPASIYYLSYGLLAYFFTIRNNRDNSYIAIISLFLIDVLSNFTESILRGNLSSLLFQYIIVIGLIRSILSYVIFKAIKHQEKVIRKKEHQKRYEQLNTLVSNIQAEMFYLKKSMVDIEKVMSKSHSLYEKNKDNKDIKDDALDIAREVHEIKKDYYRVIGGFETFLRDFETNDSMSFKDIAYIIEGNAKRYINERKKDIKISIITNDNILIEKYYSIFTIVNNLITNSIDAIKDKGTIKIIEKINDDYFLLTISDDGEGIDEDLIPYIFNPGFTTKFDENSGKSSTGIGLSHVKNIIDELNGDIKIESFNSSTNFKVLIPINSLRR